MTRMKIISDGPFRHVHCAHTGVHIDTLVMERNRHHRYTGRFVLLDDKDASKGKTMGEWKAIFARRLDAGSLAPDPSREGFVYDESKMFPFGGGTE